MIREALAETMNDSSLRAVRDDLLLEGIEALPLDTYQQIADVERDALQSGYTEIHRQITTPVAL